MTIAGIIIPMIFLIFYGKRKRHLGFREYLILLLVTIVQLSFLVIDQFTKQPPPPLVR